MEVNACDLKSLLHSLKEANDDEIKIKSKICVQKEEIIKTENIINQFQDCFSQQNERLLRLYSDQENVKYRKNQLIQAIKHLNNEDDSDLRIGDFSNFNTESLTTDSLMISPVEEKSNEKDLKRNIAENETEEPSEMAQAHNSEAKKRKLSDMKIIESNEHNNELQEKIRNDRQIHPSQYTCFPYKHSLSFYKYLQNTIHTDNSPITFKRFPNQVCIPNEMKIEKEERDTKIVKFNQLINVKFKDLIGDFDEYPDVDIAFRDGNKVPYKIIIHSTKTEISICHREEMLITMSNSTCAVELIENQKMSNEFNELRIQMKNAPCVIAIEVLFIPKIPDPFKGLEPIVSEIILQQNIIERKLSFTHQELSTPERREKIVFMDIKVVADVDKVLKPVEVYIANYYGSCLYDKKITPRTKICQFFTEKTGANRDTIRGNEDEYQALVNIQKIIHGKIIVGFDIIRKLKSLAVELENVMGIREMSEDNWMMIYVQNVAPQKIKLSNLAFQVIKFCKRWKKDKLLNAKIRKPEPFSGSDTVFIVRIIYKIVENQWEEEIQRCMKGICINQLQNQIEASNSVNGIDEDRSELEAEECQREFELNNRKKEDKFIITLSKMLTFDKEIRKIDKNDDDDDVIFVKEDNTNQIQNTRRRCNEESLAEEGLIESELGPEPVISLEESNFTEDEHEVALESDIMEGVQNTNFYNQKF